MKIKILEEAVRLARTHGFRTVTREQIADALNIATGTVSYHYGSMGALQDAVVTYSIENEVLEVIAQALAERHSSTEFLTLKLKRKAVQHLAN